MKRKADAGVSAPIEQIERTEITKENQEMPESHIACAHDLLKAIESKDTKAIADALCAAIEVMTSEPMAEGGEVSPHTYEAQNIKAAKGPC